MTEVNLNLIYSRKNLLICQVIISYNALNDLLKILLASCKMTKHGMSMSEKAAAKVNSLPLLFIYI